MEMNSLGMIKGGVCEEIFKRRGRRESGARLAWDWLVKYKCVGVKNGWYKIIRLPRSVSSLRFVINKCHNGDKEIGWRRFISDVIKQLFDDHRKFRLAWMQRWIEDIASFEFGGGTVGGEPLKPAHVFGCGESRAVYGYTRPHQPHLYKKYRALKRK